MTQRSAILAALAFLMPALVSVFLLRLWPAAVAVNTSLIPPGGGGYSLENFRYIFTDPVFLNSLKVTIVFLLIVNPLQIAISLALALLMNTMVPLIGFWRTVILLPVAIPQSVSAVVWGVALRPDGLVNAVLVALGMEPQRFLTSSDQALASIILIVSWIGVGYWMTFILAGLQDIPKSLYEAVRIDGANRWQQFRFVTLPQLRRPLTFVLVANTVANFLIFAPVQILTAGGPEGSTDLIMNTVYTQAFIISDPESAAASTVVLVGVVLLIVILQFRLMRAEDSNE
ncbi:carbohydrate ABC transporter permease [Oceaniovalibus sp. ACAM 378]|uniref:carbohydrate ABC transporter permease n=1 Tax=Oceaniovalibus sp. ACAM 378 TaxID=2599923 RepID=UPI0011D72C3F|nr:sugar ABC transporter permease [Oceaniovalibus sp. ACAM 378]TYB90146.1 sugar ABC transporter permease [Oceaniovalibus sp. ACAM 378]